MWLPLWCACLWHVVHPAGHQGSDLSSGEFVGEPPKCTCQPSPNASDGELIHLQQWNCKRISQAGVDYAQLAANKGQKVDQDWKERLQTAGAMCEEAQNSSDLNLKACKAVCAWGDVLMQGRECCNVPGPPYCTNPTTSKLGHGSVLALALLVALLAALLPKCSSSFFAPSLMLISPAEDPRADGGGQEIYRATPSPQISAFSNELQAIWNHRSLHSLPEAEKHKEDSANCFAQMQVAFDFQQDSAKNQYEHFISLWRSHVAVLCDRKMKKPEDSAVLTEALKELHGDLLASFLLWRQEFCAGNNERVTNTVYKWNDEKKMHTATLEMDEVRLHEVALFLLVWGEAANLRFMPEMLYFITHVMLEAGPSCYFQESSESARNHAKAIRCSGDGYGRSSAFLVDIVRPIYKVIFEEHYESVTVRRGKDIKKLKPTFDRYLPADAANHDDWNELFQDFPRLHGKIGAMMALDRTERYAYLKRLPWRKILKDAKTHRELHSWWGVWTGTHRIWFLHALLFFLSMFWVSSRSFQSSASGWSVLLGGNSPLVCLSFVGLLVPLHLFLWKLGTWFTTGVALRRCGVGVIFLMFEVLVACLPVVTFILVRWLDATGSKQLYPVLWIHAFVCCLGIFFILLQPCKPPEPWEKLRRPTGCSWKQKALRWLFWLMVLAIKVWAGLGSIAAISQAIEDLQISRPGREALNELPSFAFGPNWDKDMVEWLAIWGTGFICYVADTQYWFVLGCGLLGFILAVHQRGWRLCTLVCEDSVAAVPQRFAERVILAAPRANQHSASVRAGRVPVASSRSQWYVKWFPDLWDRIIDFMHCEDKLDVTTGQLKFSTQADPEGDSTEVLCKKGLQEQIRFSPPAIFDLSSCASRSMSRDLGMLRDESWPQNMEVQWRLNSFARNLASNDLPRPFLTPYVPGLTVMIPHYAEQILLLQEDLLTQNQGEEVPLIAWLEKRYRDDFSAFTNRMMRLETNWPLAGSRWDQYEAEHWKHICTWASMRSQTLWRTVEGLMLYLPALECFHQMVRDKNCGSKLLWDSHEAFTCMVCMQNYASFNVGQYVHADELLKRFQREPAISTSRSSPESFQIAFIDYADKGNDAEADGIHAKQERRYYSCLIDAKSEYCDRKKDLRREPRLRVELPGFPILGDGKGDNQNTGIHFSRGSIIQCIDANQGGYFEQMLLLPCALGEFRQENKRPGLNPRIVGFAEHITSDIGSLGDFAAGAETAFGTVLQRCYSFLGGRMHYGHPDMMNKEFMIQQGGVSKAIKTVNLSEDIFAGMDFTLRGNGRNIVHREYLHVAKGRDLGFNTILTFFAKLSAGTGEQLLTRQVLRLGHDLDLPEFLTFYYAHGGFYLTQFLLAKTIPMLVFIWLLVVLDDPENNFPAMDPDTQTSQTGAAVMATFLATQFSNLLLLFIVAQMAPLFMQAWLEGSLVSAMLRVVKQIVTLAPLHFIFQAKIIGAYITNEVTLGGAKYMPTGRGLPTQRRTFLRRIDISEKDKGGGLYNDYAVLALYDGAQLLLGLLLVILGGGLDLGQSHVWLRGIPKISPIPVVAISVTICSWLLAPFIFNPYQFAHKHFKKDLAYWREFFFAGEGRYWEEWYTKTRLVPQAGLRSSAVEIIKKGLFLGCFYTIISQKVHMLTVIFAGSSIFSIFLVIMPPVLMSILACCLLFGFQRMQSSQLGLGWSALIVVVMDCIETILYLWDIICVKWWKSFAVGLLLKFSLLSLCLELCECGLRLYSRRFPEQGRPGPPGPIKMWLHGHRMAQDIFVSSLILVLLSLGVLICGSESCGFHNLLVYRDAGGVQTSREVETEVFVSNQRRPRRAPRQHVEAGVPLAPTAEPTAEIETAPQP